MKNTWPELLPQCASAFQEYLAGGGEGVLRRAYELGRQALADGLGVLEMAVLIHRAMLSVGPRGRTPEERARSGRPIPALRRHNEMLEEVATGGDLGRDGPLPNRSGSAQQREKTRSSDERERSTAAGGATDPLFDPR